MSNATLEIAGRQLTFQGELPVGFADSAARAFLTKAAAGTRSIQIRLGALEPLPEPPQTVYQNRQIQVCRIGDKWLLRQYCWHSGSKWEYARLVYPQGVPTPAQLFVDEKAGGYSPSCLLNAIAAEHLLAGENTALLHAAYILREDGAILFTAPSGTGKSTQARLWEQYRGAQVINGDKAVLLVKPDGCYAAGLPYAGTSRICKNHTARLTAIVSLGQSKENRLQRLTGAAAMKRLLAQTIVTPWHPEDIETAAQTLTDICRSVPIWQLDCLPELSAVTCLEQAIRKEQADG